MNKGDRARLDETLAYLAGLNMGADMSALGVLEVAAFANAFVALRFPVTAWYSYNTPMHQFSQRMSLGSTYVGPETVLDRKRLRAIYLLTAALLDAGARPWGAIPLPRTYANPAVMLLDLMWRARITWAQQQGTNVAHQELLTRIRQQPATFLQTNPLNIFGSNAQATDPLTGQPTDQNVLNFEFQYSPGNERYEFHPPGGGGVGAYALPVASVKALHWTAVPGRGMLPNPTPVAPGSFAGMHGTELGGPGVRFMVTTQFTGCTFCVKSHAGNLYAAHISPAGPLAPAVLNATALAQQIDGQVANVAAGDFANAAGGPNPFIVYGRGYSNLGAHAGGYPLLGQMYMLGVRTVAGWAIYSQHRNGLQITAAPVRVI